MYNTTRYEPTTLNRNIFASNKPVNDTESVDSNKLSSSSSDTNNKLAYDMGSQPSTPDLSSFQSIPDLQAPPAIPSLHFSSSPKRQFSEVKSGSPRIVQVGQDQVSNGQAVHGCHYDTIDDDDNDDNNNENDENETNNQNKTDKKVKPKKSFTSFSLLKGFYQGGHDPIPAQNSLNAKLHTLNINNNNNPHHSICTEDTVNSIGCRNQSLYSDTLYNQSTPSSLYSDWGGRNSLVRAFKAEEQEESSDSDNNSDSDKETEIFDYATMHNEKQNSRNSNSSKDLQSFTFDPESQKSPSDNPSSRESTQILTMGLKMVDSNVEPSRDPSSSPKPVNYQTMSEYAFPPKQVQAPTVAMCCEYANNNHNEPVSIPSKASFNSNTISLYSNSDDNNSNSSFYSFSPFHSSSYSYFASNSSANELDSPKRNCVSENKTTKELVNNPNYSASFTFNLPNNVSLPEPTSSCSRPESIHGIEPFPIKVSNPLTSAAIISANNGSISSLHSMNYANSNNNISGNLDPAARLDRFGSMPSENPRSQEFASNPNVNSGAGFADVAGNNTTDTTISNNEKLEYDGGYGMNNFNGRDDEYLEKTEYIPKAGITANNYPIDSPASSYYPYPDQGADQQASSGPGDPDETPNPPVPFWKRHKKLWIFLLCLLVLLILLAAVLVPVGLLVIKKNNDGNKVVDAQGTSSSASSAKGVHATPTVSTIVTTSLAAPTLPVQLKNTIFDISTWKDLTDFNTTFTSDTVGGLPVMGLNTTFDDSAKPNEFVPALNEDFGYDSRPIRGVNLGGWLVLEPFLTPTMFEKYNELANKENLQGAKIVDEYTLIKYVNKTQGGREAVKDLMETHYSTFVNETTFKEIAEAGLDHVRIPFGYWMVKVWPEDEFLGQVSWRYLLRGIEWARKYGLRINLDLHSVPGGQNGWNHSGRQGTVGWLNGTDGNMYGDRTLEVHKQLATFFSQDRYKNIITIYGLVNEPRMTALNVTLVQDWTKNAYKLVQESGFNGTIVYGDGFLGVDAWTGIFPQEKFPQLMLDVHEYTIFDDNLIQLTHAGKVNYVCNEWKAQLSRSSNPATGHGLTFVGEWSQADTDCAPMLNNVGSGARWDGTYVAPGSAANEVQVPRCPGGGADCSCEIPGSGDVGRYSAAYKAFLLDFAEAQMHVYETFAKGYIYWNWDAETYNATQWSYKKGREIGILPKLAYERTFHCDVGTKDYVALGLPESY